jgi:hypothetical protein
MLKIFLHSKFEQLDFLANHLAMQERKRDLMMKLEEPCSLIFAGF